jgi:hypothetical protein
MKTGDLFKVKSNYLGPDLRGLTGTVLDTRNPDEDDPFRTGFRVLWSDGEISWTSYDFIKDCCDLM